MMNRICVWIVVVGMVLSAVGASASVPYRTTTPIQIKSIRYDEKARGIVVELSKKMPYQLIQVDDRELMLVLKSADVEKTLPKLEGDTLVSSISTDRLPGNILGLLIHTNKNVTHESTEWNESSGHVLVRLK